MDKEENSPVKVVYITVQDDVMPDYTHRSISGATNPIVRQNYFWTSCTTVEILLTLEYLLEIFKYILLMKEIKLRPPFTGKSKIDNI